ncbi:MAG TPA: hypothetical protein VHF05_01495 [Candidatus Paceibacterota bacterium]|nr:hypothetical protein [Candidatus Paceibacterota bacterium]
MSLAIKILNELWNAELSYKGVKVNGFGIPTVFTGYEKKSVSTVVSSLKRKGYIVRSGDGWMITQIGKKYHDRRKSFQQFDSPFAKSAPKNLIVMFDIPEAKKYSREWLRDHLRKFDYKMIQKSVWVGPSPLPKKFSDYAKEIGIWDGVRTFKLARPYRNK